MSLSLPVQVTGIILTHTARIFIVAGGMNTRAEGKTGASVDANSGEEE